MDWIGLQLIAWGCFGALFHSYVCYPVILRFLAKIKSPHTPVPEAGDDALPRISILISAFNEAQVLPEKLESIVGSDYPRDKIAVFIGSDASTDETNAQAEAFAGRYSWFRFYPFAHRQGKPGVINHLAAEAMAAFGTGSDHVLVITDANIIFQPETLRRLARHFQLPSIAVVDSVIVPQGQRAEGISRAEGKYLSREAGLKHLEGQLWGAMIGPFGGCYSIRSDFFEPVPPAFLVDDFYIVLRAIEKKGKAINDLEAICLEGATHRMEVEWRRKKRIGAGNFQNMATFKRLWWPPLTGVQFAFFSHKILRWIGPHLMLAGMLSVALLAATGNQFYILLFGVGSAVLFGLPLLDLLLRALGIQVLFLRGIRYFMLMNVALFSGWLYYLKGIESNVWQPTERNQYDSAQHH